MQTNLYVIYDKVAEESGPVYQAVNDGVAVRQFKSTIEKIPSSLRDEYQLVCIGMYDSKTLKGSLTPARVIDVVFSPDGKYAIMEGEENE